MVTHGEISNVTITNYPARTWLLWWYKFTENVKTVGQNYVIQIFDTCGLLIYNSLLLYPLFSLEKWYINFVPKLVHRPSVPFLVNVSPPESLDVATSNFIAE